MSTTYASLAPSNSSMRHPPLPCHLKACTGSAVYIIKRPGGFPEHRRAPSGLPGRFLGIHGSPCGSLKFPGRSLVGVGDVL